jgi:prevent-host-death family protein
MTLKVPISDLRSNLKQYLSKVLAGSVVALTKHGKVVAYLQPASAVEAQLSDDYDARLKAYQDGGIVFHDDIVNAPLKQYDYIDSDVLDDVNIAAEPNQADDADY